MDNVNRQVHDREKIYNEQNNAYHKLNGEMEARKMSKGVIDQQLNDIHGRELSKQVEIRTQIGLYGARKINLNQLQQSNNQHGHVQQRPRVYYLQDDNHHHTQKQYK